MAAPRVKISPGRVQSPGRSGVGAWHQLAADDGGIANARQESQGSAVVVHGDAGGASRMSEDCEMNRKYVRQVNFDLR